VLPYSTFFQFVVGAWLFASRLGSGSFETAAGVLPPPPLLLMLPRLTVLLIAAHQFAALNHPLNVLAFFALKPPLFAAWMGPSPLRTRLLAPPPLRRVFPAENTARCDVLCVENLFSPLLKWAVLTLFA